MSYYFENNEIEQKLEHLIKAVCNCENKNVSETISLYEKIKVIFVIRSQINGIEINEAILDVITRQYSKFFFSELTHQSRDEYMASNEEFYRMLSENIINKNTSICEIGSGLGKNAYFFSRFCSKVGKYYAIEKNRLMVELNKYFFAGSDIEYILGDIFTDGFVKNCDIYFIFHFLKYYKCDVIFELLDNLCKERGEIWIYDICELVDNIEKRLISSIPKIRINEFFIIIGRGR